MICISKDPNGPVAKWQKEIDKLYKRWNDNPVMTKYFGRVGQDTDAQRIFEETFFRLTGMVPSQAPQDRWSGAHMKLMADEIDRMSRQVRDPRGNTLVGLIGSAAANMEATPQSRMFLEEIRQTSNFEASQTNRMTGYTDRIRKLLVTAINEEGNKGSGLRDKVDAAMQLKKIERLEAELTAALASSDPGASERASKYMAELDNMASTYGGKVNRLFVAMMDRYTVEELLAAKNSPNGIEVSWTDSKGRKYTERVTNMSLIGAVEEGKRMMKDMGYNLARALSGLSEFTKMVHQGGAYMSMSNKDIINNRAVPDALRNRIKIIEDALSSLQDSIKTGKYYPHYLIKANAKLMASMAHVTKGYRDLKDFKLNENDAIIDSMFSEFESWLPKMAMQRGAEPEMSYYENALGVMKQYSADVINFNKMIFSQNALIKAFNNIPKGEDAGRAWQGIREYMLNVFQLHTEGYSNRNSTWNRAIRTVTAFEFVSKMGFGLTTAARNGASVTFFINHVGWNKWNRLGKEIQQNKELQDALNDAASRNVGFLFGVDASQMTQGGVLKTEGIMRSKIRPGDTQGKMEVQDNSLADKALETGIDAVVRTGGVFQTITENAMRRSMFNRMFADYYLAFSKHPEYLTHQRTASDPDLSPQQRKDAEKKLRSAKEDLKRRAANYALKMVNEWAFDYNASSKSRMMGGSLTNAGGLGQLTMQFMHYPVEFIYRQGKQYMGAGRAVKAAASGAEGSYEALRFLMSNNDFRGAALTTMSTVMIGFLTAVTGIGFTGLFENALVEKAQALHDLLTGDEEEQKAANFGKGVVPLFTGPLLSDMMTIGMASGLLELPEDEITKTIIGFNQYQHYAEDEKQNVMLRTLSPHLYNLAYKDYPNLLQGNIGAVLERNFAVAPNPAVRKANEELIAKENRAAKYVQEQARLIRQQNKQRRLRSESAPRAQSPQSRQVSARSIQARQALRELREQ